VGHLKEFEALQAKARSPVGIEPPTITSSATMAFLGTTFARLRDVISGLSTKKGVDEYVTLLSVSETCKYPGVDFLDFLRSGERDVATFAPNRRRSKL